MTVTVELPDDIAQALSATGDLFRHVLEALAVKSVPPKSFHTSASRQATRS
jgi:hypothetical protein